MKFEKLEIQLEKYASLDIIASSPEETTEAPTEATTKHDPYQNDKW